MRDEKNIYKNDENATQKKDTKSCLTIITRNIFFFS